MDDSNLYPLIERIGNLLRTEIRKSGTELGLQPVHLQALSYLARCNRYSDTSAALTEFLGATKGTVSQTLKVLEKKAYIEKVTDAADKRVQHIKVSQPGLEILETCLPPAAFHEAKCRINDIDTSQLIDLLTRMLRELQHANGSKTFGLCKTCRFFRTNGTHFHCGLTNESLNAFDSEKICREHTPPSVVVAGY